MERKKFGEAVLSEITQITPQVKDKTRCNIYIDGRFYCGLTLEAAVKNRLKVGQSVTAERLAEIQLESEKQTAGVIRTLRPKKDVLSRVPLASSTRRAGKKPAGTAWP